MTIKRIKGILKILKVRTRENFNYIGYCINKKDYRLPIHLMTIDETLEYMCIPGNSVVRFGDGEFSVMRGGDIGKYQSADAELGKRLTEVFICRQENLLVCLPESLAGVEAYTKRSKKHWVDYNKNNASYYQSIIDFGRTYGNSFVSRPYMIYESKNNCGRWFEKLISIFNGRDIVIIEGTLSRTGVGNDLFSKARSVRRIICPPNNAFKMYNSILDSAYSISKESLILIALGPAGKVLTFDLARKGYWVLDIGHIDSEYEWYRVGAKKKIPIGYKHSAEQNDSLVMNCDDEEYKTSIIRIIEA